MKNQEQRLAIEKTEIKTKEIHELIQNTPASEQYISHILTIMELMNANIGRLEIDVKSLAKGYGKK